MIDHIAMLESIGNEKNSEIVKNLLSSLGDNFEVSEAPDNDDYYINFKPQGVSLLFNEQGCLDTIFLYIMPKEGFMSYKGWIGEGIEKIFDNEQVTAVMGVPVTAGGGTIGMFNMYIPAWCKYQYLGVFMHYQFDNDTQKIDMLTIAVECSP